MLQNTSLTLRAAELDHAHNVTQTKARQLHYQLRLRRAETAAVQGHQQVISASRLSQEANELRNKRAEDLQKATEELDLAQKPIMEEIDAKTAAREARFISRKENSEKLTAERMQEKAEKVEATKQRIQATRERQHKDTATAELEVLNLKGVRATAENKARLHEEQTKVEIRDEEARQAELKLSIDEKREKFKAAKQQADQAQALFKQLGNSENNQKKKVAEIAKQLRHLQKKAESGVNSKEVTGKIEQVRKEFEQADSEQKAVAQKVQVSQEQANEALKEQERRSQETDDEVQQSNEMSEKLRQRNDERSSIKEADAETLKAQVKKEQAYAQVIVVSTYSANVSLAVSHCLETQYWISCFTAALFNCAFTDYFIQPSYFLSICACLYRSNLCLCVSYCLLTSCLCSSGAQGNEGKTSYTIG